MKKSFKEILKSSIAKVVGLALVVGMSVSILTACGQQTNNGGKTNPTKTETDKEKDPKQEIIVNPTDPEPENPENPEQPGKEDPEDPENPEQPGKEDPEDPENPEQPGKEDPENPDDPQPEDPQDEELDFSGLEAKLEEVINSKSMYKVVENGLISYSEKSGDLFIVADTSYKKNNKIFVYKATVTESFSNQSSIDSAVNNLSKDNLTELTSILKTQSDITVDGVTYSKDGIEGDNIFAKQCGVENAVMTYIGTPGLNTFNSRFSTGYSKPVQVLTIYELNKSLNVKNITFSVENYSDYTNDQVYSNLVTEGKSYIFDEQTFELGENLKPQPEIQAYNAAWMFESEEEIDYVQDALNYVYENIETFKIKETR